MAACGATGAAEEPAGLLGGPVVLAEQPATTTADAAKIPATIEGLRPSAIARPAFFPRHPDRHINHHGGRNLPASPFTREPTRGVSAS